MSKNEKDEVAAGGALVGDNIPLGTEIEGLVSTLVTPAMAELADLTSKGLAEARVSRESLGTEIVRVEKSIPEVNIKMLTVPSSEGFLLDIPGPLLFTGDSVDQDDSYTLSDMEIPFYWAGNLGYWLSFETICYAWGLNQAAPVYPFTVRMAGNRANGHAPMLHDMLVMSVGGTHAASVNTAYNTHVVLRSFPMDQLLGPTTSEFGFRWPQPNRAAAGMSGFAINGIHHPIDRDREINFVFQDDMDGEPVVKPPSRPGVFVMLKYRYASGGESS